MEEDGNDFNLMDDLLYDGFWLETTTTTNTTDSDYGSSSFWQPNDLNPPTNSFFFPTSDIINIQDLTSTSSVTTTTNQPQVESLVIPKMINDEEEAEKKNQQRQLDVVNRRLWVGPNKIPTVKKRLLQAINQLKDSILDRDVLIQIWVPVKRGGKQVLTTNNQPFSLNKSCKNLADYRDASRNYQFAADKDSKENVQGLPGRVFLKKLPEWTPDVQFFTREEYPRGGHAQQYDVRGSLALPVFEQASGNCLGVVEIVTTTQRVDYLPELENVCKALEAVDLKSSNIPSPRNVENYNVQYQAALAEIRNVLQRVCKTHNLPLAQTWAPCIQQGKGGCRHSDENYALCVSTVDSACCVADQQVSGFHKACSEHHLLKGEGIAGKAFWTNEPCFSEDIKAFRKTEYPLAHHAKVFNLCAAVAIRLRSMLTGEADFVLEFFFPLDYQDEENRRLMMLNALSSVIEQTCQSLRVVTDQELEEEASKNSKFVASLYKEPSGDSSSSWITHMMDPKQKGKGIAVSLGGKQKVEPEDEFKVTTQWDISGLDLDENFSLGNGHLSLNAKRSSEKRRAKTEKAIGLEVLRQYFAGSLKDAARSIGVCPTTLKRICRHHGITRWPSRKIKKVGHSLKKLQLVIDSVQGAEGSIQLSSFYNNFPELVSSPNIPGSSHSPMSKTIGLLPETITSKSPSSSGSHSSSSSYCVSTGVKQSTSLTVVNGGDAISAEQTEGGMLKRSRSDAELHDLGQEETKQLLVRSYSHKVFSTTNTTTAPVMPKSMTNVETFRVKATFGEEKIRLSLQPNWDFKDLQQEILRRFNIDTGIRIDFKYLDDDAEWVLLTCDADLEECIDIHKSCKSRTIKISVNQASYRPSLGSSFGSNGPF